MDDTREWILIGVTSIVAKIKNTESKMARATRRCLNYIILIGVNKRYTEPQFWLPKIVKLITNHDGIRRAALLLVRINKFNKLHVKPMIAMVGKQITFVHHTMLWAF